MKLGGLDISTVKLGASQVQAIYQGQNLVWQNAPVATAATGIGQTSFTANWEAYTGATYYLLDVSESSDFSTFVYENQVVIAPTTSYVVIGLNSNTTYYYRVRANTDYDIDAESFFARVDAASGVLNTLSNTEKSAINQLVVDMKADGIWSKMKVIYPMVGASAAACGQNLKSSSFTGAFTATGWTFASTGAKPDGVNAIMTTGFIPSNELNTTDFAHLSYYSRTNSAKSGEYVMGSLGYNGGVLGVIARRDTGNRAFVADFNGAETFRSATDNNSTNGSGFFCGTQQGSNVKLFQNGIVVVSDTTATLSLPISDRAIEIGKLSSSFNLRTDKECAFSSIGTKLTDTEASDFYTAVQACQTSLNRAII